MLTPGGKILYIPVVYECYLFVLQMNPMRCITATSSFFTTGLKTLPPLGLRPHPSIYFLHITEENEMLSQLPKANTCANILHLPTVHQTLILKGILFMPFKIAKALGLLDFFYKC